MNEAPSSQPAHAQVRTVRRSRAVQREQREAAILAAALEDFHASGLMNSRLEDIAARAGVAKGTLYLYFANKSELFRAVVRSLIQPLYEHMEQEVAHFEGPTEELLRRTLRQIQQHFAVEPSGRRLLHLMIAEGHRVPELADFYFNELSARGLAIIKMIIWRGIASGEFRQTPAAEFPHLIFAPVTLESAWPLMFGPERALDPDRFYEAQAEFLLAALRASPAAQSTARPERSPRNHRAELTHRNRPPS